MPPSSTSVDPSAPEGLLRAQIVEICKRIHTRGWLASTDGNVSVRLDDTRILATPTGVHKGYLSPDDLLVVDRSGKQLSGSRKPSSELRMHLAAYDERPDVCAVVHAHPTFCIVLSLAGVSLAKCLLPETILTLGAIPTAAYTTPTTEEVPAEIRKWVTSFDAIVLERHGSLTLGRDVFDAYNKLERMEHVAQITYHARQLGPVAPLSCEQVTRLQHVARDLGLPERELLESPCAECNVCAAGSVSHASGGLPKPPSAQPASPGAPSDATPTSSNEEMIHRVRDAMERALSGRR